MVTVILDTRIGRTKCTHTQSQELHIGILVVQLSLQCRAHSVFRLDRLRAYLVGYLQVQSYIIRAQWKQLRASDVALSTGV